MAVRLQQLAALGLWVGSLGFLIGSCALSPQIPFVRQSDAAPWITPASPVSAELQQWGREEVPVARFERRLRLDGASLEAGARATLELRALRRFEARVNGERVASGDGASWRRPTRVDVGPLLRPGVNELRVEVSNPTGPPLLSARLSLPDRVVPLRSDVAWTAVFRGVRAPAVPADDTRVHPARFGVETPLEGLLRVRDTALLLFVMGVLGFLAARRWGDERHARWLPVAALVAASAAWLALFAAVLVRIPLAVGFDARHHIAYMEWIRAKQALPLATDGWSTFHPPLFHVAALAASASPLALRALPFLGGLGAVWVAWALARRLMPDDPRRQLLATGFAAVLPMNLYSAAYFSNESLHSFLAGAAVLAAVELLLAERTRAARVALCGALFGLAALAKFTVLLLVPLAGLAWIVKWWRVERAPARRWLGWSAAAVAPLLAIAGWFYLRNWWVFGTPLVANWDLPGPGRVWWQQPGFHTAAYYARFGEALVHPYLAGFASFWDSVYSTFWGDGFVAGRQLATGRHDFWSYDFMSAGYLVALPATLLLVAGAVDAVRIALDDPDPRRRAAFSFLTAATWVVGLAFLYLTLRLAFFAQAKATYMLVLLGPLSVYFALGAGRLDDAAARWPAARAAVWGWLALFAGTLFLGFAGG